MLMTKLEAYLNDMFKCEVRTLAKYDDDDAVLYHIGRKTAIQEIKEKVSDLFEEGRRNRGRGPSGRGRKRRGERGGRRK